MSPAAKRRVLLVEDNSDAREMMKLWLEIDGHQVETAQNGLEGLRAALRDVFDVAFIDLDLPVLNGYELARQLRATAPGRRLSLVALTGGGLDRDKQEALDAGFDVFVMKPIGPDALNALLLDPPRKT